MRVELSAEPPKLIPEAARVQLEILRDACEEIRSE
jgi:hypothetical protein